MAKESESEKVSKVGKTGKDSKSEASAVDEADVAASEGEAGELSKSKAEFTRLTAEDVRVWLVSCAAQLNENRTWLSELDAPIGDADHGNNMDRGFHAVMDQLPEGDDIGALLKATAMALISKVGGAAGPLYGTMFLQASKALAGQSTMTATQVGQLLDDCVAGVITRGRAQAGDKTMLDALIPARDAYHQVSAEDTGLADALGAAAKAAKTGMQATIPMVARKGRASYLGERSAGHQDPGASSSYLILQSLAEAASRQSAA